MYLVHMKACHMQDLDDSPAPLCQFCTSCLPGAPMMAKKNAGVLHISKLRAISHIKQKYKKMPDYSKPKATKPDQSTPSSEDQKRHLSWFSLQGGRCISEWLCFYVSWSTLCVLVVNRDMRCTRKQERVL